MITYKEIAKMIDKLIVIISLGAMVFSMFINLARTLAILIVRGIALFSFTLYNNFNS